MSTLDNRKSLKKLRIIDAKIRRRREGNSVLYTITIPKKWVERLGGKEEVVLIADFEKKEIKISFESDEI